MLHKQKCIICESARGDQVYVLFVNDKGYCRRKLSGLKGKVNVPTSVDYYDHLVAKAASLLNS